MVQENRPLWEDILKFSKGKYYLAIILVLVGLLGLVVPIIPGLLLILMAIALFKTGLMAKIRKKINSVFKKY
ncbi:MAG: hypothetical protein H6627_06580 [Calditrichae bacterium]|nr:hypothetical protein [Calditrichota bacterium]MCB9058214.1 hypothetical protein [Calditrichia bacterium]